MAQETARFTILTKHRSTQVKGNQEMSVKILFTKRKD